MALKPRQVLDILLLLQLLRLQTRRMRLLPLRPLITWCWLGRFLVHVFLSELVVAVVGSYITGRYIGVAIFTALLSFACTRLPLSNVSSMNCASRLTRIRLLDSSSNRYAFSWSE